MKIKCIGYVHISCGGTPYELNAGDERIVHDVVGNHLISKSQGKVVKMDDSVQVEPIQEEIEIPEVVPTQLNPIPVKDRIVSEREKRFKKKNKEKTE
jgi:hypothetical protein